ncbi:MAG: hypothetical protein ABJE47_08930 [bacterium]
MMHTQTPPRHQRTALFSTCGLAAVLAVAAPAGMHAQSSVYANSYVYQYADNANTYLTTSVNGCTSNQNNVIAYCIVPPNPGGSGSILARGISAFDPVGGTFKSFAALQADHFTLSQFVPTYDVNGNRAYTGNARPDVVGVYSYVGLSDAFALHASAGVYPATISFFIDLDGVMFTDPQLGGASAFANSFVNFCTADAGVCGTPAAATDAFYGGSSMNIDSDGNSGFSQYAFAPAGANQPTATFAGSYQPGFVNGRLTLADIPISNGNPFDFNFAFGSQAAFFHSTASIGHIPDGCDPIFDAACTQTPMADIDVDGNAVADFYNTLTFSGYQVFDANGNDITNSVQLDFASGLNVPPETTTTPEPGTFALLAGGLGMLAMGRGRRAKADGN